METCIEPGCDRTDFFGRGLCGRHYQFYRYHGRLDEVSPRPERTCAQCGGPIKARSRQWAAAYCSSACSHKALYDRRAPARRYDVCDRCGGPMDGRRPQARYCSDECGDHARREAVKAQTRARDRGRCSFCAKSLPLHRRRFCTVDCQRQARRSENYGLTGAELQALLDQHAVCAVCGSDAWGGKGPQVDHDHATGAIRGVLCVNCNNGLGRFGDDPARLRSAAAYLERTIA